MSFVACNIVTVSNNPGNLVRHTCIRDRERHSIQCDSFFYLFRLSCARLFDVLDLKNRAVAVEQFETSLITHYFYLLQTPEWVHLTVQVDHYMRQSSQ